MDEVTQQNSVLVDENAATSKTLEQQARAMDDRVAAFRVGAVGAATPPVHDAERPVAAAARGVAAKSQPIVAPTRAPAVAPKPAAAGSNGRGAVGRMRATIATTINAPMTGRNFRGRDTRIAVALGEQLIATVACTRAGYVRVSPAAPASERRCPTGRLR
jgi:biotin carboxyl carrier protein